MQMPKRSAQRPAFAQGEVPIYAQVVGSVPRRPLPASLGEVGGCRRCLRVACLRRGGVSLSRSSGLPV